MFFRIAAVVIGILGIPSLCWQIHAAWPPGQLQMTFFSLQTLVIGVFLAYGFGIGYTKSDGPTITFHIRR